MAFMVAEKMRITIIYDNTIFKEGLKADWGFSCLVEAYGKRILFDTGARGDIFLGNMGKLNIEPETIDSIFISHAHWDHTGGLCDFLELNKSRLYIPSTYDAPDAAREVIRIKEPRQIDEDIFSTGTLEGVEQSLIIKTRNGLVVIVGCSHPGIKNILNAASQYGRTYALIGGLHGFDDFDLIRNLEMVCPTHCTQHIAEIKSLYPDKYIEGGAGKVIEI